MKGWGKKILYFKMEFDRCSAISCLYESGCDRRKLSASSQAAIPLAGSLILCVWEALYRALADIKEQRKIHTRGRNVQTDSENFFSLRNVLV